MFAWLLACVSTRAVKPDDTPTAHVDTSDTSTDTSGDTGEPADTAPPCTPEDEEPEGDFVAMGTTLSGTLAACEKVLHATAGPKGARLEVLVEGDVTVTATDLLGNVLDPLVLPRAGEALLHVEAGEADTAYTIAVACAEGCDGAFTRYPVLLLHGLGGADAFAGVSYYFGVPELLEEAGYLAFTPAVEPFADTPTRALQLQEQLRALVEAGEGRRFNVIAHSQGGLDARYLASVLGEGDRIVSIDMVATPNHGTQVADVLYGTVEDGPVDAYWVDLGAQAFAAIYGIGEDDQSLVESMGQLTTETMAAFNDEVPDVPGIYYATWAGHSCGTLEPDCQDAHGGEVVDPLLEPLYVILWLYGMDNDGMVPVESVAWGDYRGEIDADHADEIGQFQDLDNPAFDHVEFYLGEVERLKGMGF
ncbi:MAG: esterase/lipase family protein [Myxococcota bacterium]